MTRITHALVVYLLLAVASLSAATLDFTLNSVNDTFHGYPVGALNATLGLDAVPAFCVEFEQFATLGETYPVNVIQVLNDTPYARAAWLIEQIALAPGAVGDIQYAIWNILSPSAPDTPTSNAYFSASVGQNPFGSWWLLSSGKRQDFMTPDLIPGGDTQVPEPESMALIGAGLASMAWWKRKMRG